MSLRRVNHRNQLFQNHRNPPPIGVLCSGQGTNLQAIINAVRDRRLRARIAVVISDRTGAFALVRARRAGIPTVFIDPKRYASREAFDRRLISVLESYRVRLICLAGFMRVLSPVLVRRFKNRILNIHPALLPAFPGAQAIHDAIAWGTTVTGVTVHLVDEHIDHGPILLQEAVRIRPDDTVKTLLARVHRVEHRLYPRAIALMLSGKVRVVGRRIHRWHR